MQISITKKDGSKIELTHEDIDLLILHEGHVSIVNKGKDKSNVITMGSDDKGSFGDAGALIDIIKKPERLNKS